MRINSGIITLKDALMTVLITGLIYTNYVEKAEAGGLTPAQCHEEKRILVSACKPVMFRIPPTSFCCERIRVSDADCICSAVTPQRAPLVKDINYAIRVVESCGRHVPRHYKCGSITTP